MAKFALIANALVIMGADNKQTDVQELLNAHSEATGLKFTMQVKPNRNGGRHLAMPDEVFQRGGVDEKAYEAARAQVETYQVLKDAGISTQDLQFTTFRRDRQTREAKPFAVIFINNIEGVPASFRTGTTAQSQDFSAQVAAASEAYYAAGGTESPPEALKGPAAVGWYKGRLSSIKTAEVAAELDETGDEATVEGL